MGQQKIRTIIVEDETYDRQLIEKILQSDYSHLIEVINSVRTVEDAVRSINNQNPDLVFLDIELNGDRNGAFNILDQVEKKFKIIFVTAKSDQDDLLKAIKLSCIDYLIKPTKISDFQAPIKKVLEELNHSNELNRHKIDIFRHNAEIPNIQEAKISLQEGYSYKPTSIKDIIWCEAEGNYSRFYFTDKTSSLINGNLKSFEEILTDFGFSRISKSEFINLSHVKTFSRKSKSWEIMLSSDKTLFISPPRKQSFLIQYNNYHLG